VTGDPGGFDSAAADLLPPGDVGSPERVWPQSRKVAALSLGGLVERIGDTGVPEWPTRRSLLLEVE